MVTAAAAPAVAVAVICADVNVPEVAVSVCVPTVVPSVQLPTVATPLLLVVCVAPETEPLPDVVANVTVAPATALPNASVTRTEGAMATVDPTVPVWLAPVFTATVAAAPATGVAENVAESAPAVTVT
jgi:hypothetical protein